MLRKGAEISFWCSDINNASRKALVHLGIKVVNLTDDQAFLAQDWRKSIVVADGYHFGVDFWQRLKKGRTKRTVCIDDFRAIPYLADLVICYNEGVLINQFKLSPKTRLFLGGKYLLLRPEILAAASLPNIQSPRRAFMIAAGGTRQEVWLTKMLTLVSCVEPSATIWVLSGRRLPTEKVLNQAKLGRGRVRFFSGLDANDMIRLYRQAKCLIVPASTLMLEAFSAGCPVITGWIADNQRNSINFYEHRGLIVNAGDLQKISLQTLTAACARMEGQRYRMALRQRNYIQNSKTGIDEIVQAILGLA
jgi:UDP-2,4-diacetamido-2,4,6-trideoxy-beta-L-altropyranose hydrolase